MQIAESCISWEIDVIANFPANRDFPFGGRELKHLAHILALHDFSLQSHSRLKSEFKNVAAHLNFHALS